MRLVGGMQGIKPAAPKGNALLLSGKGLPARADFLHVTRRRQQPEDISALLREGEKTRGRHVLSLRWLGVLIWMKILFRQRHRTVRYLLVYAMTKVGLSSLCSLYKGCKNVRGSYKFGSLASHQR